MIKPPKLRRCTECPEMFAPKRKGLKVTKQCSTPCEMDAIQKSGNQKKKPKAKKKKTAAALKKELWPIFSLHQKIVHSVDGVWCHCYTCEKPLQIGTTNCQGGHCLSKAVYKNLYFDERAVRPQCYYCNINLGGMHYDFCEKLKQEIGEEAFAEMKFKGRDIVKRNAEWYLHQIAYYTMQNEILMEQRR